MIFSGAWLRGISPIVHVALLGLLLTALLGANAFARDAPSFWISSLEGKRFDSRRVGDEPFVLSFFFVNCQPCIREMPLLNSLMDERFPKVPLLFIDPLREDSREAVQAFANRLGVPEAQVYRDRSGMIARKFFKGGKTVFPTIIGIYDGEEIFRYTGLEDEVLEELVEELEDAL